MVDQGHLVALLVGLAAVMAVVGRVAQTVA